MNDCIFCKIVKGEIPSYKIYEDENHIAILDIFPDSKGKTVLITKGHKPSYILENDKETSANLLEAAKNVAKILDEKLTDSLRTTFLFEGLEVPHLHVKLIPFYKEMLSTHNPDMAPKQELEELHKLLTS